MSSEAICTSIVGTLALLAVCCVAGAGLYGCVRNNQQNYGAQANCVDAGGSWIPLAGQSGALCLVHDRPASLKP